MGVHSTANLVVKKNIFPTRKHSFLSTDGTRLATASQLRVLTILKSLLGSNSLLLFQLAIA